jgi:hypothetical protein
MPYQQIFHWMVDPVAGFVRIDIVYPNPLKYEITALSCNCIALLVVTPAHTCQYRLGFVPNVLFARFTVTTAAVTGGFGRAAVGGLKTVNYILFLAELQR